MKTRLEMLHNNENIALNSSAVQQSTHWVKCTTETSLAWKVNYQSLLKKKELEWSFRTLVKDLQIQTHESLTEEVAEQEAYL